MCLREANAENAAGEPVSRGAARPQSRRRQTYCFLRAGKGRKGNNAVNR
jgi:hypothetical protein